MSNRIFGAIAVVAGVFSLAAITEVIVRNMVVLPTVRELAFESPEYESLSNRMTDPPPLTFAWVGILENRGGCGESISGCLRDGILDHVEYPIGTVDTTAPSDWVRVVAHCGDAPCEQIEGTGLFYEQASVSKIEEYYEGRNDSDLDCKPQERILWYDYRICVSYQKWREEITRSTIIFDLHHPILLSSVIPFGREYQIYIQVTFDYGLRYERSFIDHDLHKLTSY